MSNSSNPHFYKYYQTDDKFILGIQLSKKDRISPAMSRSIRKNINDFLSDTGLLKVKVEENVEVNDRDIIIFKHLLSGSSRVDDILTEVNRGNTSMYDTSKAALGVRLHKLVKAGYITKRKYYKSKYGKSFTLYSLEHKALEHLSEAEYDPEALSLGFPSSHTISHFMEVNNVLRSIQFNKDNINGPYSMVFQNEDQLKMRYSKDRWKAYPDLQFTFTKTDATKTAKLKKFIFIEVDMGTIRSDKFARKLLKIGKKESQGLYEQSGVSLLVLCKSQKRLHSIREKLTEILDKLSKKHDKRSKHHKEVRNYIRIAKGKLFFSTITLFTTGGLLNTPFTMLDGDSNITIYNDTEWLDYSD